MTNITSIWVTVKTWWSTCQWMAYHPGISATVFISTWGTFLHEGSPDCVACPVVSMSATLLYGHTDIPSRILCCSFYNTWTTLLMKSQGLVSVVRKERGNSEIDIDNTIHCTICTIQNTIQTYSKVESKLNAKIIKKVHRRWC